MNMAHVEPMDLDGIESDFDNKENTFHINNALPRAPCFEKGHENLDMSEVNVKLRCSITQGTSSMSKSFTTNIDAKNIVEDHYNGNRNSNLTRSLNSTLANCDGLLKSPKSLPLQTITTGQCTDLESNIIEKGSFDGSKNNIKVNIDGVDMESLSLPSTSSSLGHTPEATTPTKEVPKDGGSPILRGLKSVLSMFRSSQSPIPLIQDIVDERKDSQEAILNLQSLESIAQTETVLASTPMKNKNTKTTSPLKESVTFNDDLEKELQWKEDSAVFCKEEKVPLHILFPSQIRSNVKPAKSNYVHDDRNISVEYMDISLNETITADNVKEIKEINTNTDINNLDSDSEFKDCETTLNNSEADCYNENEPLKARDLNTKPNIIVSSLEFGNTEDSSTIMESKKSFLEEKLTTNDTTLNNANVIKMDIETEVTNSYKENTIDIDPSPTSHVTNETIIMDVVEEKWLQNTELENSAIKLNDTVDIETYLDTEDSLGTEIVETLPNAINNEPIVERVNIDFDNKHIKLNKTIDVDLNSEETETMDKLLKSYSVEAILEPKQEQISLENEEEKSNVTVDIETHTENLLYHETKEKVVEMSDTNAENLNETQIKTIACNDNILDRNQEKNPYISNNIDSGVMNNHTPIIEANNENIQVNLTEVSVDQENYIEPTNDFPDNRKETETKFTKDLEFTTAIDDDTCEKISKKSILPDVVQSNENPKFLIDGEDIYKYDIEIGNKSNSEFMNADKFEDQSNNQVSTAAIESGMLHDNTIILEEQIIEHYHNDNVRDKVNNKIDLQNTAIANASINSKNIEKVVSKDNIVESLIMSVENNQSLTINESQAYNSLQQNSVSKSEHFDKAKNIMSEHNMFSDESVCLQPDILNENQKMALNEREQECLTNKISSTYIMNDHIPQEYFGNTRDTEMEQIALSKEEYESSASIEKCDTQSENGIMKNTVDLTNDENLTLSKQSIPNFPVTGDNNDSQENIITNLKTDSNLEINVIKTFDSDLTFTNECNVINEEVFNMNSTESKLDQDDLEVENINKSQSVGSLVVDNPFKTKSKLLETPPASPKIESKGYNFNFDEMDDPFATRTMTVSSPSRISPANDTFTPIGINKSNGKKKFLQNKRKSQPFSKKQNVCTKKTNSNLNKTASGVKENMELNETQAIESLQSKDRTFNQIGIEKDADEINIDDAQVIIAKGSEIDSNVINDQKRHELNVSYDVNNRNVFNLPEIDDRNFNPFTTRTKVCSTPPLVNNTFDAVDIELLDSNKNNVTVIVNNDDTKEILDNSNLIEQSRHEDETLKEVHTEDEDTIEGPFLEVEDSDEIEKGDKLLSDEKHDYDMAFDDFPKQQSDEAENEMFIDAEAFEFLLNQNQANIVADSGKESLFLKFDPLFAKRVSSDGILAALSNFQKKQSTPKKEKQPQESQLYAETTDVFPSCSKNVPTFDLDESIVNNISKPTMVVNPAVVSPRKTATPPKINRQSLTFTSPAMAVIDKLLSLSGNSSATICHDSSIPQSCSEQHHTDVALTQLREMLAEKEMHVQVLRNERKELTNRLGALESQVKSLEFESEDRLRKIKDLNNELSEKNKQNKNMATVVEEYERTIATLVAELEQAKKRNADERMRLIKERNEQTAHLSTMEISFNDLHSKYEKSKQIILSLKSNEDCLKKSLQDFADNQVKIQNNYELLKQHATAKLNHANQELEKLNKGHEAEVLKLQAMMKRKDLHISSLEETLSQKTKANKELTAICDELISKVG